MRVLSFIVFLLSMVTPLHTLAEEVSCPQGLKTPQAVLMNVPSELYQNPIVHSVEEDVQRITRNIYEYRSHHMFNLNLNYDREFITDVIEFEVNNKFGRYIIMLVRNGCVLQSWYAPSYYRNAVIGLDL